MSESNELAPGSNGNKRGKGLAQGEWRRNNPDAHVVLRM